MKWSKREHGAASISVTAYAGNHAARAFYAALGFKTLNVVLTNEEQHGPQTVDTPRA
ncbi:hypothetical protein GCM10025872_30380 [Barrientosiimonas endolithica]|uniref:N-acetyltransferase domain-containing protein n=1 Tax=Barrientosiimonas endolithica TaxID=1535208 RepID=A0ABM8HEE9_9MICO|nr:hypothetical protein GCM10025872_30380 [Barrientosiimonas endolithica]